MASLCLRAHHRSGFQEELFESEPALWIVAFDVGNERALP